MILETKAFGYVEIQDTDVFTFDEGIPGFPNEKRFAVLYDNQKDSPFMWLQAVDNPNLTFVIVDPYSFKPDYGFVIDPGTMKELGIETHEDVLVFSIVVIPEDISRMSANLRAPIIINHRTRKGKQYALENSYYSVRHYIVDEIKESITPIVGTAGTGKKKTAVKKPANKKKKTVKENIKKTAVGSKAAKVQSK